MFRPGGKLTVTLAGNYNDGLREVWHDRPSARVEDQIGEVVVEAVAHAAALRVRREEQERRLVQAEEAKQKRERDAAEQKAEDNRIAFLKERVDLFEEADALARFVRHLRHTTPAHRSEKMGSFLQWAEAYVQHLRESCSAAVIDDELRGSDLW